MGRRLGAPPCGFYLRRSPVALGTRHRRPQGRLRPSLIRPRFRFGGLGPASATPWARGPGA
eukprot:8632861-Lingulodinium_polyedra.AAC.1